MHRVTPIVCCLALLATMLGSARAQAPADPGQPGPYDVACLTRALTNSSTGSILETDICFPSNGSGVDPGGAPYPALVFSHGTDFLGTGGLRHGHAGNTEHLASWGFIVALPDFPDDDIEVRASDVQYLLSYLEAENENGASWFFQKIDTSRFSATGHSLGGMSPLMLAARDDRITMAALPLDPVNPNDEWDYEGEGPDMTAPLGLIGSPSQMCNAFAGYNALYPKIGSTHKAKFVIADGTHCDFLDPEDPMMATMCGLICGAPSAHRLQLIERYTAAWFNYYLHLDTDYYAYLYGDQADEDIRAGRIIRDVQTAPRDVEASTFFLGGIRLTWALYQHPIIAGYDVYRRPEGGTYPSTPYAQVGRVSSFWDKDVVEGEQYFYALCSRDAAGNQHQLSSEVTAVARAPTLAATVYLPLILKSY